MSQTHRGYRLPDQLPPVALQVVGLALIIGGAVYWGITGHDSPELLSAGVALSTAGLISRAARKNNGNDPKA